MNNPHLIGVLCQWGQYIRSADNPGIGYPRQCSYTKLIQNHDRGVTVLPDDIDDSEMITRIINNLARSNPYQGGAIYARYKHGGAIRHQLKMFHRESREKHEMAPRAHKWQPLSRAQYYRLLEAAHENLAADILLADELKELCLTG